MRYGILLIGLHGATGSTFANHFIASPRHSGFSLGSYWPGISNDDPILKNEYYVSGWDFRDESISAAIQRNGVVPTHLRSPAVDGIPTLAPIIGPLDYAHCVEGVGATNCRLSDAIDDVRNQIRGIRETASLDRIFVINLSSPMRAPDGSDNWNSATAYSRAAIAEGCDWAEFTPSDSIDSHLVREAKRTGSIVIGRDGSTGQTLAKLLLLEFMQRRGLNIGSWYSTNLIGNHDGRVLSTEDYSLTKIRDKRAVLDGAVDDDMHTVHIVFNPPSGDNKEAWDCVHFTGWCNAAMSFRLNWLGADSYLAGGLITDIVRFFSTAAGAFLPPGLSVVPSILFKNPIGAESTSFSERYQMLVEFIKGLE